LTVAKMIDVPIGDDDSVALWQQLATVAALLPGEWVIVGGLMVQLHAFEHGDADVRVTRDIDVLAQARPQGALTAIAQALRAHGFEPEGPDLDGFAHRFVRDGLIVDVLAPDGIRPPPTLDGTQKAIGIPGGSQALSRSEEVRVCVKGESFTLRRPTLLGAILIKARSLMVHADPEAQREDLLRLLSLVEDPRAIATDLKGSERKWLCAAEQRLELDGPSPLDDDHMRLARLTFRLLVGP
jgi:hypothetical protein